MTLLNRYPLRWILIFAFLTLSLLPLAIIASSTWAGANRSAQEKAASYASAAAGIADKIDRNLFERYGDVQAFGLNQAVRNREVWHQPGNDNPIVQAMNSYVDTYDIYYLTMLVDPDGKLIAVNSKDQDGQPVDAEFLYEQDFANAGWFKDCKRNKFYENEDGSFTGTVVEHLYVDEHVKKVYGDEGLALGFSAPVYGEDGSVIAYWKNVTKFSVVEDVVLSAYLELKAQGNPSVEITLLDGTGNVIVDCDPSTTGQEAIIRDLSVIGKFNLAQNGVEAAQRVLKGEAGSLVKSWHSRKEINQVAGYAPFVGALGFPGMHWNALVRVACSEALATSNNTKFIVLLTIGITTVIVTLIAFWISTLISKTLVEEAASMEAAGEGDFTRKVDGGGSKELARSTKSLNRMLDALAEAEERDADNRGQIAAISATQAVIEFDLDGNIITANDNFLQATGYRLDEIQGKHHRMFCDPEFARTREYAAHWEQLGRGETIDGRFQRVRKDGGELWLQAFYAPILSSKGKVLKVIKYATDITETIVAEQRAQEAQELELAKAQEQENKVASLLQVVRRVADGDLSASFPDLGTDAVGKVSDGVQQAVEAIRSTLLRVTQVAGAVATSAKQMASTSEHISSGAQEQASSLEETAASLEEITSAVKQNTDNSQQAQQLSIGSREVAEAGGSVVSNAVSAMTDINSASKEIAEIITTIDEIAFQTNLLALNAAVEAARAGEQGRGFAVVASEVRNLAQRSAGAAKEIKTLIQDSVAKVENGTELVNKSGDTLQEIVTSVKRVADIVTEISAASTEQLTGIEQVNSAVSQMDRVTQTNAAQTEEMTASSQSLLSQAENLRQLVSSFRLGENAASGANFDLPSAPAAEPQWDDVAATDQDDNTLQDLDLVGVGADTDFEEF